MCSNVIAGYNIVSRGGHYGLGSGFGCSKDIQSKLITLSGQKTYSKSILLENFMAHTGFRDNTFSFQPTGPLVFYAPSKPLLEAKLEAEAVENQVVLETTPASVVIIRQPPHTLTVNSLVGVVDVQIRTDAGAPLNDLTVKCQIFKAAVGSFASAASFFRALSTGKQDQPRTLPTLSSESEYGVTNKGGVARFQIRVVSGIPADYYFKFSVGSVASVPSRKVSLLNDIKTIAWLPGSTNVVENNPEVFPATAVLTLKAQVFDSNGNPFEGKVAFESDMIEEGTGRAFNVKEMLAQVVDAVNAKQVGFVERLDPSFYNNFKAILLSCRNATTYADAWSNLVSKKPDLAAAFKEAMVGFVEVVPASLKKQYDETIGDDMAAAVASPDKENAGALVLKALETVISAAHGSSKAENLNDYVFNHITETVQAAVGMSIVDVMASADFAAIPLQCESVPADLAKLLVNNIDEVAQALASSTSISDLSQIFKLFVSGGQKIIKRNKVSSGAIVNAPLGRLQSEHLGNGTHALTVGITGTEEGEYLVDVYANGIPAPLEIKTKFRKKELEGNSKVVVTVFIYLLCLVVMLTNTKMNGSYSFIGGFAVTVALAIAINIKSVKETSVLLDNEMRFWMVLVTLIIMVIGFLYELIRSIACTSNYSFAERRQRNYIQYVQRLFRLDDTTRMSIYPAEDPEVYEAKEIISQAQAEAAAMGVGRAAYYDGTKLRFGAIDDLSDAELKLSVLKTTQKELAAGASNTEEAMFGGDELEKELQQAERTVAVQTHKLAIIKKVDAATAKPHRWQVGAIGQLKAHFKDVFFNNNAEAFYFPQMFLCGLFIGCFLLGYQTYITANSIGKMANNFRASSALPIRKSFTAMLSAETLFFKDQGADLKRQSEQFVLDQAYEMESSMQNLGDSIDVTGQVGIAIALLIVLNSWIVAVTVFREEVLNIRRTGKTSMQLMILRPELYAKKALPVDVITPKYFFEFVGLSAANTYVSFLLLSYFVTFVLTIFVWDTSRNIIWDLIVEYHVRIILLAVAPLATTIVKEIGRRLYLTSDQRHFTDLKLFQLFTIILTLMNVVAGFAAVILRVIIGIVGNFVAMSSVVHINSPIWMYTTNGYALFGAFRDKIARSFAIQVWTYAQQNNPTVHVFMWLLIESAAVSMAPKTASTDEENKPRNPVQDTRQLARNRWHVAYTLLKNPGLVVSSTRVFFVIIYMPGPCAHLSLSLVCVCVCARVCVRSSSCNMPLCAHLCV